MKTAKELFIMGLWMGVTYFVLQGILAHESFPEEATIAALLAWVLTLAYILHLQNRAP